MSSTAPAASNPSSVMPLTLLGKWSILSTSAASSVGTELTAAENQLIFFHLWVNNGGASTTPSDLSLPTLDQQAGGSPQQWTIKTSDTSKKKAQATPSSGGTPPISLLYEPGVLYMCQLPGMTPDEATAFRKTLDQNPQMAGETVDFPNNIKTTLLYSAARANNGAACSILIEHGANPLEICSGGNTAAHVAFYRGNLATFDSLCWAYGSKIDPSIKNNRGERVDSVTIPGLDPRVTQAALCATRSEQWHFLNSDCEWEALPQQQVLADVFAKDPQASSVVVKSPLASGYPSFDVNFAKATVSITQSAANPAVPSFITEFLRVDGKKATVRIAHGQMFGWTKLENIGRGQYFTEVTDLSLFHRLETAAAAGSSSLLSGTGDGSLELDQIQYRRYRCTWFYRKGSCWFPVDPNAAGQLTMVRNQGIAQFPTVNRTFDLQCMTAFDRGAAPTQILQIAQPLPQALDVASLRSLSDSAARNLEYLANSKRTDDELKQDLSSGNGLSANLALIYVCLHRLGCLVKGGAIRDVVIRSSASALKDLDCELMDEAHCTKADVVCLQQLIEHTLDLPTRLQNRAAFDNFLGRRTDNPDDLFSMKVLSGPHQDVDFELVSPKCLCYYPPRNVDVTVNNLAVSPSSPGEIHQLVPLPGAVSTTAIVSQLLKGEASPVYDFDWATNGDCVGRAPTEKRARAMQARFDKMKSKGFKLVRPPTSTSNF